MIRGGERIAWGAKTIPEGGFVALPKRLHAPGLLFCGDGAGMVNVPALKGIHYAVESGRLAAEAAADALRPGRTPWTPGALGVYGSRNRSRDDAPSQLRVQTRVPEEVAVLWERMCPAQVYEAADGTVEVTPSNCVQCGAITAKGGRLTPPEGGSGPEYTLT